MKRDYNHIAILALCAVISAVSSTVLIGWFLDIDILKRITPGFVTMKFSTSLSFLFTGIILLFTYKREKYNDGLFEVVLPITTLAMAILMGTSLISVVFGFDSGIERLFVPDDVNALLTSLPGQPSIGTMVAFVLVSILGIVAISSWKSRLSSYIVVGIILLGIGLVALLGYLLSEPSLYYSLENVSTAMAIHTATLFMLTGVTYILIAKRKSHETKK